MGSNSRRRADQTSRLTGTQCRTGTEGGAEEATA
jgi:hypothetical protein